MIKAHTHSVPFMTRVLKSKSMKVAHLLLVASGLMAIMLVAVLSGLQFGFWPAGIVHFCFAVIFIGVTYDDELGISRTASMKGILTMLILIIVSWFLAPTESSLILTVVLVAAAPDIITKRQSWLLLLTANLAFFAVFVGYWQASDIFFSWLSMFALQGFAITSSLARVHERELKLQLAEQNAELTAARSALAQKSQMEERLRIAGDLHDSIGHQLTALRLQLEALFQLAPEELKPPIAASQQLSSELLENIRSIVKRMSSQTDIGLGALIKQLDADTPGVDISLVGAAPEMALPLAQQLEFCIKEGLSNAIRHGKATEIQVSFDDQHMFINDNGVGADANAELGFGLNNLLNRLALFGPQVTLRARQPNGCCLEIALASGFSPHTGAVA